MTQAEWKVGDRLRYIKSGNCYTVDSVDVDRFGYQHVWLVSDDTTMWNHERRCTRLEKEAERIDQAAELCPLGDAMRAMATALRMFVAVGGLLWLDDRLFGLDGVMVR